MSKLTVQIQNYQIINNARLEFDEGLNIIVGPSNNGKSAIFRAIEAAIYNKVGNSFIKQGTEMTAVGIKNEEHVVIWKKSADAGVYKVDGQVYNKIGRGQLEEVASALNIQEIEVNSGKVRVNFLKQMEYPFLLDKTPSQLFEFLSMSNDNDKLLQIFQTMRSDLRALNSNIDITTGKVDSYKEIVKRGEVEVQNYSGVDDCVDKVLSLDSRVNQLDRLSKLIISIESLQDRLKTLESSLANLKSLRDKTNLVMQGLPEKVATVKSLDEIITKSDSLSTKVALSETRLNGLKQSKERLQNTIISIPMDELSNRSKHLVELKDKITTINNSRNILLDKRSAILDLRQELTEIKNSLAEFKVCPLCGSAI